MTHHVLFVFLVAGVGFGGANVVLEGSAGVPPLVQPEAQLTAVPPFVKVPVPVPARVTPDYLAGPWFRLPVEHPFNIITNRRPVEIIVDQLQIVEQTMKSMAGVAATSYDAEDRRSLEIIRQGNDAIATINGRLELLTRKQAAWNRIPSLQDQLEVETRTLAGQLKELSQLKQFDAEIRFPSVERIGTYVSDLQNAIRVKESALCQVHSAVPSPQVNQLREMYDKTIQSIRTKLNQELNGSSAQLAPLTSRINATETLVAQTESRIKELKTTLAETIREGAGFLIREPWMLQSALADESALIQAVEFSRSTQTRVLAETRELLETQMTPLHQVISILDSMTQMSQEELPPQKAFEPPYAMKIPTLATVN